MSEDKAGKKGKCSKCGAAFEVPAPEPTLDDIARELEEAPKATHLRTDPVARYGQLGQRGKTKWFVMGLLLVALGVGGGMLLSKSSLLDGSSSSQSTPETVSQTGGPSAKGRPIGEQNQEKPKMSPEEQERLRVVAFLDSLKPFRDACANLNSRLTVGMTRAGFQEKLGDVAVARRQITPCPEGFEDGQELLDRVEAIMSIYDGLSFWWQQLATETTQASRAMSEMQIPQSMAHCVAAERTFLQAYDKAKTKYAEPRGPTPSR